MIVDALGSLCFANCCCEQLVIEPHDAGPDTFTSGTWLNNTTTEPSLLLIVDSLANAGQHARAFDAVYGFIVRWLTLIMSL